MKIDAENRLVSASVGEFAAFRPYAQPGYGGVSAIWRAQLGSQWHRRIQAESKAAGEDMADEMPIEGRIDWRGWGFQLSGRIDQFKQDHERYLLREIKTLSEPVPIALESLYERYLSYPIQLLAYRELLLRAQPRLAPESISLELLLIEIGTGLTQTIRLAPEVDGLLSDQLDSFVDFLESKQERLARLRSLSARTAYPSPRPGQETIQADLDDAFRRAAVALLEAPTGYGKTGVAWERAVRALADGTADRIIYLTSKSTGQTEAVERLRALLEKGDQQANPAFWQIRNKQEHCIHHEFRCSALTCPYLQNLNQKWKQAGLQRLYLMANDELNLDTLKAEGRATGICPYEIMRAGLGYRDIWIGDYNYLFSPQSARLLEVQPDFDPSRVFLILDEIHNLPSRVASAYTFDFPQATVYAAIDDLRETRASARLKARLGALASLIGTLEPNEAAVARDEAEFDDCLAELSEIAQSEALPFEMLQPETLDLLFLANAAQSSRKREGLQHILWSPAAGAARLECIDASRLIQQRLSAYPFSLGLSATLSPLPAFLAEIGLDHAPQASAPPRFVHLVPPAPWRQNAYHVAIDLRVDTRLRSRFGCLPTTAATIAAAAEKTAPAIVFFPSYAYAEKALDALSREHPFIRAEIQPRGGGSLSERSAYLEQALAFNDALFLILGSSYAEGIDSLGGKAGIAIVVGPALPEMNFIQEAKRKRCDASGENGFERAYLQPGLQKVNQALGRLVRAPGQQVKALLHCQRFGEPKTRAYLDPLYRKATYIHTDADLDQWLASN